MKYLRAIISVLSIMLVCMVLGAVLGLLLSLIPTFTSFFQPPARIASPSIKVDSVLGIMTPGFFAADPVVRSIDGKLYEYSENLEQYYPLDSLPKDLYDTACQQQYVNRFEQAVGKIASCREIQPNGEFCSAPYTIFASTLAGELWVFRQEQPCWFSSVMLMVMSAPVGLVVGLGLGIARVIRHSNHKLQKRRN